MVFVLEQRKKKELRPDMNTVRCLTAPHPDCFLTVGCHSPSLPLWSCPESIDKSNFYRNDLPCHGERFRSQPSRQQDNAKGRSSTGIFPLFAPVYTPILPQLYHRIAGTIKETTHRQSFREEPEGIARPLFPPLRFNVFHSVESAISSSCS